MATYIHVNCPIDNASIHDIAARYEAALRLFGQQCPAGVRVAEIEGIRGKGKRKCAWRVRYVCDRALQCEPINVEQVVFEIYIRHPNNTVIIEKRHNIYPPAVEIVYSCMCMCKVSQNVGMSIKRSASVETINKDLVNLKVEEENIQE